jgi:Ca2+-binding RTX toxin-like protein
MSPRRLLPLALVALAALVPATPAAGQAPISPAAAAELCQGVTGDVSCGPGNGRRTAGGGEKVSHAGWPAITGILWKVDDAGDRTRSGGDANDELLGHHGDERLDGKAGDDVLWGDWDPVANTTHQRDTLAGGSGDDWLYPSHGASTVLGGPGDDHVWAFYGHGTIDCGPGHDTVRVRLGGAFTVRNCEVIANFCAFGSKPGGGCYKPGERPADRSRRR